MTKLILLPVTLAVLLASCNSTPVPTVDPPFMTQPPIITAYTSLDTTVDLTRGNNGNLFQNVSSPTYYLVKVNAAPGVSNLMAKTTLGTDGHARLTLPDATAMTPFLDQVTPSQADSTGPGCTVKSFSVSPSTFKIVTANHVLKIGDPSNGYSGYLGMSSVSSDGSVGRPLVYVDQDVTFNSDVDCFPSGRENRNITALSLHKGWNVINISTVQSGTASAPIYTQTSKVEPVISATASLLIWTSSQTDAPRP